jgi:hypothetical protein
LNAQELDDMTLFQIHRIGPFRLSTICISAVPASFSQGYRGTHPATILFSAQILSNRNLTTNPDAEFMQING